MVDRVKDFLARHRRKFVVTGVLVGGTYFALRYAQRKLIEFQETKMRELVERSRRLQHFESTERTCNQVIIGMGAELGQAIIRECSTDDLLAQLRHNPPNKLDLWEEMKIVAFTRLATLIYATSMMVVVLRVQLNLLGGYLYRDAEKKISEGLKQQYLSFIRHFIYDGGLAELVRYVRTKVVLVMKPLPLTKPLSLTDLEQLFWSLQMAINSDVTMDPNARMAKYLLPGQEPDEPLLQRMYNETLDLLECDDASSVCANGVCRGFSLAMDAVAESLAESLAVTSATTSTTKAAAASPTDENNDDDTTKTSDDANEKEQQEEQQQHHQLNNNTVVNINKVEIALAKLIPIVSGLTSKGFDSSSHPPNLATSLVTFYVVAEKCKVLGANVYETFSTITS